MPVPAPSLLQPHGPLIPDVHRIAVLRSNSIGDFVLALPALAALRAAFPAARITYLGEPWHPQLLDGRPGPWDEVVVVPPHGLTLVAIGYPESETAYAERAALTRNRRVAAS